MNEPEVAELLSENAFIDHLERGGVIVIDDDSNPSGRRRVAHLQQAHKACSHVRLEDFQEKVLQNRQANGRYWWTLNSKVAERELAAPLCLESARLLGRA